MTYTDIGPAIRRESDGASIPKDVANSDYLRALEEVSVGTSQIVAKPLPTKSEKKSVALATATALHFSLDQLRVIRALVLLTTGTPAQKTKAAAFLQPLLKLVVDAKRIGDQIDADTTPDTLEQAVIPTEEP